MMLQFFVIQGLEAREKSGYCFNTNNHMGLSQKLRSFFCFDEIFGLNKQE